MPQFKDTLGKDFLDKYDGMELFKQYTPKVAKLPKLAYKPYLNKKAGEVLEVAIKLGRCTREEGEALEKAFNDKYGDK